MPSGYTTIGIDRSKGFDIQIDNKALMNPIFTYGIWNKVDDELPEKVIFNNPATILIWKNGDKTIVKTMKEDKYDPMVGFLMAYFKYHSGLSGNQREKYFKKIVEESYGR